MPARGTVKQTYMLGDAEIFEPQVHIPARPPLLSAEIPNVATLPLVTWVPPSAAPFDSAPPRVSAVASVHGLTGTVEEIVRAAVGTSKPSAIMAAQPQVISQPTLQAAASPLVASDAPTWEGAEAPSFLVQRPAVALALLLVAWWWVRSRRAT